MGWEQPCPGSINTFKATRVDPGVPTIVGWWEAIKTSLTAEGPGLMSVGVGKGTRQDVLSPLRGRDQLSSPGSGQPDIQEPSQWKQPLAIFKKKTLQP